MKIFILTFLLFTETLFAGQAFVKAQSQAFASVEECQDFVKRLPGGKTTQVLSECIETKIDGNWQVPLFPR